MPKKTITTTEEVDETPVKEEAVAETPKEEKVVEAKAPEIDIAAIKAEVAAEILPQATDAAKKSLVEQLTGGKDQNEYEKWVSDLQKEGRNPTYAEALKFVKGQAKDEILAELNKEVSDEEEKDILTKQQQEENQKATQAYYNKQWDQQLTDLEKSGKIPPITDAKNENDPGNRARTALFEALNERIAADQKGGRIPSYSLIEIFYEGYRDPQAQPPGATAPVFGQRKGVSPNTGPQGFKYSDIKGKKPSDILAERYS